jgi:hypothetical protein
MIARIIASLEEEITTFEDNALPFTQKQLNSVQRCRELFTESAKSLANRSRARRSMRNRACLFLLSAFHISPEVFLLCVFKISISALGHLPDEGIPRLRKWAKTASFPKGLRETANYVCKNSFQDLSSVASLAISRAELPFWLTLLLILAGQSPTMPISEVQDTVSETALSTRALSITHNEIKLGMSVTPEVTFPMDTMLTTSLRRAFM